MARYTVRRGPPSDFGLATYAKTIPGLIVDQEWDDGELWILSTLTIRGNSTAATTVFVRPIVDEQLVGPTGRRKILHPGGPNQFSFIAMQPITAGRHTVKIDVWADSVDIAAVLQDESELWVLQLPLWQVSSPLA